MRTQRIASVDSVRSFARRSWQWTSDGAQSVTPNGARPYRSPVDAASMGLPTGLGESSHHREDVPITGRRPSRVRDRLVATHARGCPVVVAFGRWREG